MENQKGIASAKSRVVWIDWMRVSACFMVMMVHALEPFYIGGEGVLVQTEADAWWVAFFNSVVRMCVPLFVIASSYLLFPLNQGAGVFFRKRAARILIPWIVWSLVYAIVYGDATENLCGLLFNFNYCAGHLWFVYMIMGLYLLMPILSPWAERVSRLELQCYLFLCFFTTLIPLVRDGLSSDGIAMTFGPTGIPRQALYPLWGEASWNSYGVFYYFSGFIGYLLLGLYFRRFVPAFSWKRTLAVALPCWIGGFAICFGGFLHRVLSQAGGNFPVGGDLSVMSQWETFWYNDTAGVALMTVGTVLLFRKLTASGWFYKKVLLPVSKASYGMYLAHLLVLVSLSTMLREWLGVGSEGILGIWTTPVQIMGGAFISFVFVAVCCVLLQRIPRFGKWLVG